MTGDIWRTALNTHGNRGQAGLSSTSEGFFTELKTINNRDQLICPLTVEGMCLSRNDADDGGSPENVLSVFFFFFVLHGWRQMY